MKKGYFIALEGPDGVGKSTIIEGLKKEFPEAIFIHEPGTTDFGKEIRNILLHKDFNLTIETQILLFISSFVETSQKIIIPALKNNKLVIADRWYMSTMIYQGYVNKNKIVNELINKSELSYQIMRSHTFILMANKDVIEERRKNRNEKLDNYEKNVELMKKVYSYYKNMPNDKIHVNGTIEENIKKVKRKINKLINY